MAFTRVRIRDARGDVTNALLPLSPLPLNLATWLHNSVPGLTMCSAHKHGWLASNVILVHPTTCRTMTLNDLKRHKNVDAILFLTASIPFNIPLRRLVEYVKAQAPHGTPVVRAITHRGCVAVPLSIPHPDSTTQPYVAPARSSLQNVLINQEYYRVLLGALNIVFHHLDADSAATVDAFVKGTATMSTLSAVIQSGHYDFSDPRAKIANLLREAQRVHAVLTYYQMCPSGAYAILPRRSHVPIRWFCNSPWTQIVNDHSIRTIGDEAFVNSIGLQSIKLSSLRNIGRTAFWMSAVQCVDLRGATITNLPECTFLGCTSLTTIYLNGTLTTVGASAFMNTAIKEIDFPPSIRHLGSSVCRNTPLERASLHCNVPAYGFSNCDRLRSIHLGNHTRTVGQHAFYGTKLLRRINIAAIQLIGKAAFAHSGLAGTIHINGVVCTNAFYNVDHLTVVVLGKTTSLLSRSFANCPRLTTVLAPSSLDTHLWSNLPSTEGWIWSEQSPFKNCNYMLRWEHGLRLNFQIGSTTPYVDSLAFEEWCRHRPNTVASYFQRVQQLIATRLGLATASIPVAHIVSFLHDGDVPVHHNVICFTLADLQGAHETSAIAAAQKASTLLAYARAPVVDIHKRSLYVTVIGSVAYPGLLAPWLSREVMCSLTVWQSRVADGRTTLVVTPHKPPPYNNYHKLAERVERVFRKAIANGCTLYRPPRNHGTPMV